MTISITSEAAARIRRLAAKEGRNNACFRVGVTGGGCNGLSYVFEFTPAPNERDFVLEFDGVTVCVDQKSLRHLAGSTLHCAKSFLSESFVWENPNETSSCSCGSSFSVDLFARTINDD